MVHMRVCVGGRWVDGGRSAVDRIGDMRPPPPPVSHNMAAAATGASSSSVAATQNVGNLLHMAGGCCTVSAYIFVQR